MPLRGELNSVDLAHVFQMLVLNQKAGTLEITHSGVRRQIYFARSGLVMPCERELLAKRVTRSLVSAGKLTDDEVRRARCNMEVVKKGLLDTLVEMQLLSAKERDEGMREQLEEEVYELFFLADASFEFRDGEMPTGGLTLMEDLPLSPNGLIMEAARRVDEWQYITELVHSGGDVFEATGSREELAERSGGAELATVFDALDGASTVDEIIERTGISRFLVFRQIALLIEHRQAAPASAEALLARARERMEAGSAKAALPLFERAIALGSGQVDVYAACGQAYESVGEVATAAARYLAAGRCAEEQGDLDAALKLYLRNRAILPTQVEARERLFALRKAVATRGIDPKFDAEAEGVTLAHILFELGRGEELALVLSGLLDHAGESAEAIERVSALAARLGRPAFATEALLAASAQRRNDGDLDGAMRCVKRAQSVDPNRPELQERVIALQRLMSVRRERRQGVMRSLGMVAGFALCFVGYGKYSAAALDAYGEYSLEDFVQTRDFAHGKEHFSSIRRRYPLTIPFLLASEKLRELEIAEAHAVEIETYRQQILAEKKDKGVKQARSYRDAALEARHSGNYDEALALLRRARACCGDADPLQLDEAITELETYLAEAARLKTEATFFRNAGRFDEAYARMLELAQKCPASPEAEGATLPVRIESDPPGASIKIDGVPVRVGDGQFSIAAETPFVVDLPFGRPAEVVLELDGYAPHVTRVDAAEKHTLLARLPHRVDLEAILPEVVVEPPAADANAVALLLRSGRVSLLDAATLEVRWTRELPDLLEAAQEPLLVDALLLVPVNSGELLALARSDGSVQGRIQLPAKATSPPVASGGRLAVACGDVLAVGTPGSFGKAKNAGSIPAVALPAKVVLGPCALSGGRFVVACDDGKVWLCAADGSLAAVRIPAGAKLTCLTAGDDALYVGDAAGRLHVVDIKSLALRCSVEALEGRAVASISPDAALPVVSGDGRTVALDCTAGKVVATLAETLSLATGTAREVVASDDGGRIRLFDRDGLAERTSYATDGAIRLRGRVVGSRAYFAADGGHVVGVGLDGR